MSEGFDAAVAAVLGRLEAGGPVDGTFKFAIPGEGVFMIRDGALLMEDGEADVTITATLETFRDMFEGALSPTAAFMTGRMDVDGDMAAAMRIGKLLA